jgi:CRP-like cAMP-binding protein
VPVFNYPAPEQGQNNNHLLAALPDCDYARLLPHLELVPLSLGQVLQESGRRMRYGYFPTTAIVSRLYVMADGASAEIAVIGNEGMVGVPLFLGGETTVGQDVVQSAGQAYRLPEEMLRQEFNHSGELPNLLLRYTMALLTHMAQTAVCNRHHSLEQQLCRCLLQRLDRLASAELIMTQEQIANILGVRREGVTEAAGRLQSAGLIDKHRGHVTVVDRAGLTARACECYAVVKKEFDRLLPQAMTAGSAPQATSAGASPGRHLAIHPAMKDVREIAREFQYPGVAA